MVSGRNDILMLIWVIKARDRIDSLCWISLWNAIISVSLCSYMYMQNYRYLDLLNVLCVCDGVAIPDNQNYITERWLRCDRVSIPTVATIVSFLK